MYEDYMLKLCYFNSKKVKLNGELVKYLSLLIKNSQYISYYYCVYREFAFLPDVYKFILVEYL